MKTCFDSKVEVTDRFLSRLTATDSLSLDLDLLVHTKLLLVLLWRQDSLMSKAKWTIRNQRLNGSHMRIWQQRDAARWGFCSEHLEAACRGSSQLEIRRGASYDEWFSHFYQTIDSVQGLIEGDDGTEVNPLWSGKPRRLQRQLMCVLFIRQCRSAGASSSCGPKVHPHKKNCPTEIKTSSGFEWNVGKHPADPPPGLCRIRGQSQKKRKTTSKANKAAVFWSVEILFVLTFIPPTCCQAERKITPQSICVVGEQRVFWWHNAACVLLHSHSRPNEKKSE